MTTKFFKKNPAFVILILFLTFAASSLFMSCDNNESRRKLQSIVTAMNMQCPIKYDLATCTSADITDNEIVINYVYDENIILGFDQVNSSKIMGSYLFNESLPNEFVDLLISSGYDYKAVFKGAKTRQETTIRFKNKEIKQIKENPIATSEILTWQIEVTRNNLPIQIDEFTEWVKLEQDENVVSYTYVVDEDKCDMDDLLKNKDQLSKEIRTFIQQELSSKQSTSKNFYKLICNNGKGFNAVFTGNKTDKKVTVEISNKELSDLISQ